MSQHAASNSRRDNAVASRGWAAGVGKDLRRWAGVRRLSARQPSTGPIPATAAANHDRHHPRDRGGYRQGHLAHNHSPACVAMPLFAFFLLGSSSSRLVPPRPSGLTTRSGTMDCGRHRWPKGTTEENRQKNTCTMPSSQVLIRQNTQTSTGQPVHIHPAPQHPRTALAAISAAWPQTSSCRSTINQSPTGSGSFSSGQLTDNGTVRRDLHAP